MGLLDVFKKDNLEDVTYIEDMRVIKGGEDTPFTQYDIFLDAGGYGWNYMVDSADYMSRADIVDVQQLLTHPDLYGTYIDLLDNYKEKGSVKKAFETVVEGANLSIAGFSNVLKQPMKIVWFNQTRVLRIFTTEENEEVVTRYVETVIRRTFGTKKEMLLAKPLPEKR